MTSLALASSVFRQVQYPSSEVNDLSFPITIHHAVIFKFVITVLRS